MNGGLRPHWCGCTCVRLLSALFPPIFAGCSFIYVLSIFFKHTVVLVRNTSKKQFPLTQMHQCWNCWEYWHLTDQDHTGDCALLTVHPLSFCTLLRKMQKSLKEIHYYWSESVFFSEKALIKEFHPSLTDSLDLLPPRHLVCPEVVHEFSGVDSYLWRVPVLSCSYTNKTGYIIKVCGVCNSCSAWTGKERWYISMADFQLDKIRLPEVSAIGSWRSRISK